MSIAISIILKSNFNIFLCGIVLTLGLEWLRNRKGKDILAILTILVLYSILQTSFQDWYEKRNNVELSKGVPMISFVYMGMAEEQNLSSGWYTQDTVKIYERNSYDYNKAKQESVTLLKNRLKHLGQNPGYTFHYFADKLASTWLNPTYETLYCSMPGIRIQNNVEYEQYLSQKKIVISMLSGKLYQIEENYFNTYQIILFAFAAFGMLKLYRKEEVKHTLLPIIFLGGFVFHIFWETKAIYVIQYVFLLIPYASYGLYHFYQWLKKVEKKKMEEIEEGNKGEKDGENKGTI